MGQAEIVQTVSQNQRAIEGALSHMLKAQATIEGNFASNSADSNTYAKEEVVQDITEYTLPHSHFSNRERPFKDSPAVPVLKFSTSYEKAPTFDCRCNCHRHYRSGNPRVFQKAIGQIFLGYTGLPIITPSCSMSDCDHHCDPTLWIDYYFPAWFLNWKLHAEIRIRQNSGPEFSLRVSRVVPSSAEIIRSALQGDTARVKSILRGRVGSPFDTDGINTPLIVRNLMSP